MTSLSVLAAAIAATLLAPGVAFPFLAHRRDPFHDDDDDDERPIGDPDDDDDDESDDDDDDDDDDDGMQLGGRGSS